MSVKLLTEHHLEFLSLTGGCTGSSESTLVKMSNCWKAHATAQYNGGAICGKNQYRQNIIPDRGIVSIQFNEHPTLLVCWYPYRQKSTFDWKSFFNV